MVAAVGYENNVSNQRYHGTVDKTKVGINNLIILDRERTNKHLPREEEARLNNRFENKRALGGQAKKDNQTPSGRKRNRTGKTRHRNVTPPFKA